MAIPHKYRLIPNVPSMLRSCQKTPYHSTWRRLDSEFPDWREFHRTWWGSAGRTRFDEVRSNPETEQFLYVAPDSTFTALTTCRQPSGGMLVRRDYEELLARIRKGYRDDRAGIILVGLPASGKTCFNIFVLLECMAQLQNVLFTTVDLETYLVDELGVWMKHTQDVRAIDDLPPFDLFVPTSRVWSIVDAYCGRYSPPSQLLGLACFALYPIPLPRQDDFRRWFIRFRSPPLVLTMRPWLGQELLSLILDDIDLGRALARYVTACATSLQCVEQIRSVAGPLPRDIFAYLQDPARCLQDASKVLDVPWAGPSLGSFTIDWSSIATFDTLLLVKPLDVHCASIHTDLYVVDFRSTTVAAAVLAHARVPDYLVAEHAFRRANESVATNALSAWAFEALAILSTSGHIPPERSQASMDLQMRLHPMSRDPSSTDTRPRFVYGNCEHDDVLTISPEGLTLQPQGNNAYIQQAPTALVGWGRLSLPIYPREITTFTNLARDVSVDPTRYFVSAQRDHPFFDAVFFAPSYDPTPPYSRSVIIWVLRTGLAKADGDAAASSCDLLCTLQTKVLSMGFFPVLKYVVVVPLQVRQSVVWEFPPGWEEDAQGEVYVQFLDPLGSGGERGPM